MRVANPSHPKVMDHLQEPNTNVSFFSGLTNMIKSATTWVHTPEVVERTSKPSHRASPYSIKNRPTKASSRVADRTPSPACSFISESNPTPSVPSLSHSSSSPSQSQTQHLRPESTDSSQASQPPQTHSDGIHCYMDRPTIFVSESPRQISTVANRESPGGPSGTLSQAESGSQSGKIPKPPGEVGRPNRGGYNLSVYLGWPKRDYDAVRVGVEYCLTVLI